MDLLTIKKKIKKIIFHKSVLLAVVFFLLFSGSSLAQMSGTLYKIPVDSINVGGQLSTSPSYKVTDSAGEIGSGSSAGTLYSLNSGFLAAQTVYLSP